MKLILKASTCVVYFLEYICQGSWFSTEFWLKQVQDLPCWWRHDSNYILLYGRKLLSHCSLFPEQKGKLLVWKAFRKQSQHGKIFLWKNFCYRIVICVASCTNAVISMLRDENAKLFLPLCSLFHLFTRKMSLKTNRSFTKASAFCLNLQF